MKPEYVIPEVIGDFFGNFIYLFMKYEIRTSKKIKIFQLCEETFDRNDIFVGKNFPRIHGKRHGL